MTNQPHFPNMEPAAVGQMHEQTFNLALAAALRTRRKAWRDDENAIIAERTGVLDAQARRPDILVQTPDIYPIVLEVEFGDPAFADARSRLGKSVVGTTFPIRSAIAIGAPVEVRNWPDSQLRERLAQPEGIELKYAILSANIQGDEGLVTLTDADIHTWPENSYVTGNLEDLAVLCEYAAAPPLLVSETAKRVAAQIRHLAGALQQAIDPATAQEITRELGQTEPAQGLRMACCIWLTSLRLQNLLAGGSDTLKEQGLKTIAELREGYNVGRVIILDELRAEWEKILKVNYRAIFGSALKALHPRIPDEIGSTVLTELSILAARITALRLGNRVDFAGELFPELLSDRAETAAHYTLPETAELLSQLAVARMNVDDWQSAEAVSSLKLADFACGTGSLLRAAYGHIRHHHDAAGGTGENLHRRMMEESIVGLDINTLAAHMTAAGLSTAEMATEYYNANIAAVAVLGGQTGSLELLEKEEITDVTGQSAQTAADTQEAPTYIAVPHESRDLIIQNPPYSRARGKRKVFDIAGIKEPERRRSENRLKSIRSALDRNGNRIAHGQAGLGADFSALADRKLKKDAVFATVLPLTAAHAESWQGFRKALETDYRDLTAIAFTSHEDSMMSADTNMNEMLVIGVKRAASKPDNEQSGVLCINLTSAPESVAEAYWYAKLINKIGQPQQGSDVIYSMGKQIGSWIVANPPISGFPWFTVGMQNHHLARSAVELMRGRLYSPQDMQGWDLSLEFTTLGALVEIGPTHDLIGHPRGGDGRGAFTFDEMPPDYAPTYPALWGVDSKTQKSVLIGPTHEGHPVPGREAQQRYMLAQRGDLFISRNLRMTSQALAAARTPQPAMGGTGWTALQSDDDGVQGALAIWLNSTLGLVIRVCYAQTTQQGRARMQVKALAGFPVPDFTDPSPAGERAREVAQDKFGELSTLELAPVSYAFRDRNRQRIDAAVLEMLGLGNNQDAHRAVEHLRNLWCREPAVHGGDRAIKKALGIGG